jgi:hypothetical protein
MQLVNHLKTGSRLQFLGPHKRFPQFEGSSALSVQAGGGKLDMFDTLKK